MWGLHIELACAKPRWLWRLFGAEALFASSRRRHCLGRRGGEVAPVPVPGHETPSLTPHSLGQDVLATRVDAPRPPRLHRPVVRETNEICCVYLL